MSEKVGARPSPQNSSDEIEFIEPSERRRRHMPKPGTDGALAMGIIAALIDCLLLYERELAPSELAVLAATLVVRVAHSLVVWR